MRFFVCYISFILCHMAEEKVILVDENDRQIGLMEKIEAHEKALLHRAFSVFILNSKGDLMLQRRALTKYHSPGLWTNTCCSHQRENETTLAAAQRRLQEEMGFTTTLTECFSFIYKAEFDNGLTEHEFDHVLTGIYNDTPVINEDEVAEWKWIDLKEVQNQIKNRPEDFTPWFKIIFEKFYEALSF